MSGSKRNKPPNRREGLVPEDRDILRTVAEWISSLDDKLETEAFAGALLKLVVEQRHEAVRECAEAMCYSCGDHVKVVQSPPVDGYWYHVRGSYHFPCKAEPLRRAFSDAFSPKEKTNV